MNHSQKHIHPTSLHIPSHPSSTKPNTILSWILSLFPLISLHPRQQAGTLGLPTPVSQYPTILRPHPIYSRLSSTLSFLLLLGLVYALLSCLLDQPNQLQLDPIIDPTTFQVLPAGDPLHFIRSSISSPSSSAAYAALQLDYRSRQADFHLRVQHAVHRNITKASKALNRSLDLIPSHSDPSIDLDSFQWYQGDPGLKRNRPASQFKCDLRQRKQGSLLFIGIFTTPEGVAKRNLIRTLFKTDLPPSNITQTDGTIRIQPIIDLVFVSGRPQNDYWKYLIEEENKLHSDIIILKDVDDNIDAGKTYEYFKWVALGADGRWERREAESGFQDRETRLKVVGKPQFVIKSDDDTFLVVPNLIKAFQNLDCDMNVYWGTSQGSNPIFDPYFRGLAYGLSWPLVEWIGTSNMSSEAQVGIEDARVGAWLTELNQDVDPVTRVEVGWKMGDWNQMEIDENTIGLHWLKHVEWFPMVKFKVLEAWKRAGQVYRWDLHIPATPKR